MARNNAHKAAARAYQRNHPGTSYTEALRRVATPGSAWVMERIADDRPAAWATGIMGPTATGKTELLGALCSQATLAGSVCCYYSEHAHHGARERDGRETRAAFQPLDRDIHVEVEEFGLGAPQSGRVTLATADTAAQAVMDFVRRTETLPAGTMINVFVDGMTKPAAEAAASWMRVSRSRGHGVGVTYVPHDGTLLMQKEWSPAGEAPPYAMFAVGYGQTGPSRFDFMDTNGTVRRADPITGTVDDVSADFQPVGGGSPRPTLEVYGGDDPAAVNRLRFPVTRVVGSMKDHGVGPTLTWGLSGVQPQWLADQIMSAQAERLSAHGYRATIQGAS